ncbi:MAG: hypothetical protein SFU55_09505 [Methylophilus sp.]|nr:hypothetical protein [Methylophilus sp.]
MDVLEICQKLADEVNTSIKESYNSDNAEEKRNKFFLAQNKLAELKITVKDIPGGYITGLEKFEVTLEKIEDEYYEKGIFLRELFSGWVYQAEFRLETPLTALLNHGEFRESIDDLDAISKNQKHGGWVQKTRSFREMGLDVDEIRHTFIASIVGLIPPNGGLFLEYLIELREIVESDVEVFRKKDLLEVTLSKQQYYGFNRALGGKEKVIRILLKSVGL